jgi:hypothetical protein
MPEHGVTIAVHKIQKLFLAVVMSYNCNILYFIHTNSRLYHPSTAPCFGQGHDKAPSGSRTRFRQAALITACPVTEPAFIPICQFSIA